MKNSLADIEKDFAQWYLDVVYEAELADQSPVRGSIVVRPYGYRIWGNIKKILNQKIIDTGHENALFPLFIPESFLKREADHVEGFAPELAVVTHAGGKKLEENLVVRPTSETMIHYMFAKWIKSWRDLPIKINQWANVVRWEMRTRPFLRTSEIFWQEGHTAHATAQEADEQAVMMHNEYVDLYENYLAIPVVAGLKSESEKFAGADKTYTIESLMRDGKALQMCTSHRISQNFAKSFDMVFQNQEGKMEHPHLTSWGFTTRSVGAVIMVHGDQKGLVLPPKIAPMQVVVVPIFKKGADTATVLHAAQGVSNGLKECGIRTMVDANDHETPGAKFYKWELKGVPLRIEIGPRDVESKSVVIVDRLDGKKETVGFASVLKHVQTELERIQSDMFERAKKRMTDQWHKAKKRAEFAADLESKGGFYQTGWCGSATCEQKLKENKATIRCLLETKESARCFECDQNSSADILIARAY